MVSSKRLMRLLLFLCISFNFLHAMEHQSGNLRAELPQTDRDNRSWYLIPFRMAQKLIATASSFLGYDQAARLPLEQPLREVIAMIDHDQPFIGLIIDPNNKTDALLEYFRNNPLYNLFIINISNLMAEGAINETVSMVKELNKQIEEASRTIIILENIECLFIQNSNNHIICQTLFEVINAYHQNAKVSIIGIADNLPMVPGPIQGTFTSIRQLPTMSYSERRNFFQNSLPRLRPTQTVQEWQYLFPFARKEISLLGHEQFVDALAQQTEGYSFAALKTLATEIQMRGRNQGQNQIMHEAVTTTTNNFQIVQTVGAKFSLQPLNWITRPSLWLRYYAWTHDIPSSARHSMLKAADRAQYHGREPTNTERLKDLAQICIPKLTQIALRKSIPYIIKLFKH